MSWQPIETAPKDGTRVLLFADGNALVGYWEMDNWSKVEWFDCDVVFPTHWTPLPEPPSDSEGKMV